MDNLLTCSPSPHLKSKRTTKGIMADVCIALCPAVIMGIVYFGLTALLLIVLSVLSAVLGEFVFLIIAKKPIKEIIRDFDFSSLVTGLLVGLTIGTNYPWYTPVFGSIFAVVAVKMLFGGTGKNVVNPAIAGRIFIFISFQAVLGAWVLPSIGPISGTDITSSATALESITKGSMPEGLSLLDLFLGTGLYGCIGETCKAALIVGGVYLAVRGVINIGYPAIYIAVTGLLSCAIYADIGMFLPTVLSGGLVLGAIFMATDYVTTPNTTLGNIIYFAALGCLTAVLRYATKMETVSFAILLMNLTVPLIDRFVVLKPFGHLKIKKEKKQ